MPKTGLRRVLQHPNGPREAKATAPVRLYSRGVKKSVLRKTANFGIENVTEVRTSLVGFQRKVFLSAFLVSFNILRRRTRQVISDLFGMVSNTLLRARRVGPPAG